MLKLPLYQDTLSFWSFVTTEFRSRKVIVVSPSPQIADSTRRRVGSPLHEVKTMSAFIKEIATELNIDLSRSKRKSELILELAKVAKKNFDISHQEFFTAFNVFTELRGVSSDQVVVESILEEYLPRVREWVLTFYQAIEKNNWLDEHGLYEKVADELEKSNISFEKEIYIFYGFKHLTGSQVDLIKKIALEADVYLPYRKELFDKSWMTDWIQWFSMDAELLELEAAQNTSESSLKIKEFHEGQLSPVLHSLLKSTKGSSDIILSQKGLSAEHVMMVPHDHLSFKIPYDFFVLEVQDLYNQLEYTFDSVENIKKKLWGWSSHYNFELVNDFKRLKLLTLLSDTLTSFGDKYQVDSFDWKVIFEVLRLDIPRLNLTSFFSDEVSQHRLLSLNDLDDPQVSDESILILGSAFSTFKGVSTLFSEKVEKFISSISPIKRSELEDDFLQAEVVEAIKEKGFILLLEKDLLDKEPRWLEVVKNFKTESISTKTLNRLDNKNEHLIALKDKSLKLEKSQYFSATRLQSYIDCDYAYFHKYVEPIFPNFLFETELESRELGNLEHQIVAEFCQENNEFDEDKLGALVRKSLNEYLVKENKRIDRIKCESFAEELIRYCSNGVKMTFDFSKAMAIEKTNSLVFERAIHKEFPELSRSGAIDCSLFDEDKLILIDYKRGAGGIPSNKEIHMREKIQFLFYLNVISSRASIKENTRYFMGYLCLGDVEHSLLWADDLTQDILIEQGYPKKIFKKTDELLDTFRDYPKWEIDLIDKMKSQTVFEPKPRRKDVCTYCELKNICDRGASL